MPSTQTVTGASETASAISAQVRMATWVWPSTSETRKAPPSSAAQPRWSRKVAVRSGLALWPLGVTTKPERRRSSASSSERA
jgi:hypothetical protein